MNAPDDHNMYFHQLESQPRCIMGPYASAAWTSDPKHLLFAMARYKFCAKMFSGADNLLEIGCGDGFHHPILLQSIGKITAIDIVPGSVRAARQQRTSAVNENVIYECRNIIESPFEEKFVAAISIDVLEHIPHEQEDAFIENIALSLKPQAACIIGTPNIAAAGHMAPENIKEHINLKDWKSLKELMLRHFHAVFIFSMNDEVVHTGFYPMAHYLFALAVSPRKGGKEDL